MLFVLSAKTQPAMLKYMQAYLDFCKSADERDFLSICYTSCVGREHYKYRFACVVRSIPALVEKLGNALSSLTSTKVSVSGPRCVMGFPGQGAQYQGMAFTLAQRYPQFLSILSEAAGAATVTTGVPILPYLIDEELPSGLSLDETRIGQVCIFLYQYAMYRWLGALGVQFGGVMGHSVGEICAAGTLAACPIR
jgi:acyl transferase domain-containing protein